MKHTMRLLLIESAPMMVEFVRRALTDFDLSLEVRESGKAGIECAISSTHSLILIGLDLLDMTGHQVVQELRGLSIYTPLIMLAKSNELSDKLTAYGSGADDFLVAPFHGEELLARIRAVIRRSENQTEATIYTGLLAVNTNKMEVEVRGRPLRVTKMEYRILEVLSRHKGRPISRQALLDHLYHGAEGPNPKALRVFLSRLRKKIADVNDGENYIMYLPGDGHMLCDQKPK